MPNHKQLCLAASLGNGRNRHRFPVRGNIVQPTKSSANEISRGRFRICSGRRQKSDSFQERRGKIHCEPPVDSSSKTSSNFSLVKDDVRVLERCAFQLPRADRPATMNGLRKNENSNVFVITFARCWRPLLFDGDTAAAREGCFKGKSLARRSSCGYDDKYIWRVCRVEVDVIDRTFG